MVRIVTPVLLTGLTLLVSCGQTRSGNAVASDIVPAENKVSQATKDTSLLFDGQTLEGWEITNFGPQGPVSVSGGNIMLGMGDGCTGVTWKGYFPVMNYEVSLEAKRVSGIDFFCGMTFPVDDSFCSLIVGGWAGNTVGISSIDRKDASENETTLLRSFETDRWYTIRTKVTSGRIEAWIDDEQVVNLETAGKELSVRPEVGLSRPFGIASWRTTAAIRNIRLEYI
ncbi:MAG: DUF1080 domain-containing protein [Bacteroidales bacterium]|nr:DUF1080 domain-containing protein [Bacteroidales bacterium]